MKLRRLQLIALAILGMIAPHALLAQSVGQRSIETIDVKVLNAELVAVGRIVAVTGKPGAVDAVIAVQETLKGEVRDQYHLHVSDGSDSRDLKELFKRNKAARLLVTGNAFTSLDNKSLTVPTASGILLRDPVNLIEYVREVLRTHPDLNRVAVFRMPIPETWSAFGGNGSYPLIVPVDSNLEKWALETLRSRPIGKDYQRAFEALRSFFKSDQTIALFNSLFDDPTFVAKPAETNNGIEVRSYEIRRLAHESMKTWGIESEQPVIHEEIPRFNTVETLTWTGRPTDADIETMIGAPYLKSLTFNFPGPSDAQLARIGQSATLTHLAVPGITDSGVASLGEVQNLEELDLSMSRVSDWGLAILERLPNLKRLRLAVTRISDDGLETLARFPKLEFVNLTLSRVTKERIADSRRTHPALRIEQSSGNGRFDTFAFAAFTGDTKTIRQGLNLGADPNRKDVAGNAAIFYAISQNQYEIVKLLLDQKARVDILDAGSGTPLQAASRSGYLRIMKLLLDRGTNVNHVDSEWNTALHLGAQKGSSDTIQLLLDAGALISARNREGLTPLDTARKYRNSAAESEILKSASATQSRR